MEQPNNELMSALSTLLEAGKYSDLSIVCGSKRYAVHRAIICSRSGFFDGACSSPFREAETGIIDLGEDDAEAVEHMVHYFYHLDYLSTNNPRSRRASARSRAGSLRPTSPVSPSSPMSPRSPTRRRAKKLNLALVEDPLLAQAAASVTRPRYDPLTPPEERENQFETSLADKIHASQEEEEDEDEEVVDPFEFVAPEQQPNVDVPYLLVHAKVYALADKYGISGLKALARRKFSTQMAHHFQSAEFPPAIQEVYDSTVDSDRGLRDVVTQTFRANPALAHRKDVEEVVKETPNLAWELFRMAWGMPV
ncbi:hypothetical protein BDY21DRAFT_291794 [Lineolata rhizophorae]|uniref:BTB domain-containing protein n=1 Tax=Lineolata rhizophorae TaxID=578093 RepID=A0A6A6NR65_9PEZI|nr:hypothetical protein BDY21DRAFT_291794 [Lineolata rhizophorae]